ncbi:hypothetical protein [Paenibacillus sp. FSL H8-0537]|uniref:hypothetical protein n=1 Tax=Paenibacillus sp. FSL H8-0537 TaxID=2921399 RepID=UPI003100F2A0
MIKELDEITRELNNVQAKKEESLQLELSNKISLNLLMQRMEFLDTREKELNVKATKIKNEIEHIKSQSLIEPDYIHAILQNFLHVFEDVNLEF